MSYNKQDGDKHFSFQTHESLFYGFHLLQKSRISTNLVAAAALITSLRGEALLWVALLVTTLRRVTALRVTYTYITLRSLITRGG